MIASKPKLLDLYCGAGGAGMGYYQAGFEVVGVDLYPQKHYPFEFHRGHAMTFLARHGHAFDLIHASPPCQAYSLVSNIYGKQKYYVDFINETRDLLQRTGKPYVIENVERAPLHNPLVLCGRMFGLSLYRHRAFECSFGMAAPIHPVHDMPLTKLGRKPKDGEVISIVGHFTGAEYARKAMGISWMTSKELAQAIPPAYTRYIGLAFLQREMESVSA